MPLISFSKTRVSSPAYRETSVEVFGIDPGCGREPAGTGAGSDAIEPVGVVGLAENPIG